MAGQGIDGAGRQTPPTPHHPLAHITSPSMRYAVFHTPHHPHSHTENVRISPIHQPTPLLLFFVHPGGIYILENVSRETMISRGCKRSLSRLNSRAEVNHD